MQVKIQFTNLDSSESLKTYINEKVEKLDKLLENIVLVRVELSTDKHHRKGPVERAEVLIKVPKKVLYAAHQGSEMHESIDLVMEKLERQARKYNEKFRSRRKREKDRLFPRFARVLYPKSRRDSEDDMGIGNEEDYS
ncbi:ribosome hibernation-promoting factor, HPF/YfiA family [Patescibacteria group bacterium]